MRLFITIAFDETTKGKILAVQRRLKELGRGRFTSPENIHLTLAFLGEGPEDRLPDVKAAMDRVDVPRLKLSFEKIGCFRKDSELWWIGLREDPALLKLQKEPSSRPNGKLTYTELYRK